MPTLTIDVIGTPISQGSMIANGYGRGMRHSNRAKLLPWRQAIINALLAARPSDWDPSLPLTLVVTYRFARPKSHFGAGRNADMLKATAPQWHITKCDLDKCLRATLDAIEQSGLANGDQQVCSINAAKRYALPDEHPGALLTLIAIKPPCPDSLSDPYTPLCTPLQLLRATSPLTMPWASSSPSRTAA